MGLFQLPGRDARVELRHGWLVDVCGGRYFPPGTRLVIEQGRIAALPGLPGEPEILPDFVVDLGGRSVIPGLFNTHGHLQAKYPSLLARPEDLILVRKYRQRQIEKSLVDCLLHGVTHFRDALPFDLRANRELQAEIRQKALPGPRIYQCILVAPLRGALTQPANRLSRFLTRALGLPYRDFDHPESGTVVFPAEADPVQVRAAVDRAIEERGAEYIKLYDQEERLPSYRPGAAFMNVKQIAAAVDQAHRRRVLVTMHHGTVAGFRRGVQAGVPSLAHLPCDAPLAESDVAAFKAAGGILEPTATLAYYFSWAGLHAPWELHPRMARLAACRDRTWEETVAEFWLPELAESARGHFRRAARGQIKMLGMDLSGPFFYWGRLVGDGFDNLQRLFSAGVRIACGNDAGAVPATEGMVGLELVLLALALEGGAVPFDGAAALQTATVESARALGVERDFGSLAPGKVADLAVIEGDPLADPAIIGRPVAALWMDGRLVVNACGLTWTKRPEEGISGPRGA